MLALVRPNLTGATGADDALAVGALLQPADIVVAAVAGYDDAGDADWSYGSSCWMLANRK